MSACVRFLRCTVLHKIEQVNPDKFQHLAAETCRGLNIVRNVFYSVYELVVVMIRTIKYTCTSQMGFEVTTAAFRVQEILRV